ncbi:MAG: hypothetical protein ABI467_24520 [Kofleriaceae bacterium]
MLLEVAAAKRHVGLLGALPALRTRVLRAQSRSESLDALQL